MKALMQDDPIYLGELEFDLLAHRDHSLSSSQNISTHLSLPWPIKEIFMDHVKGDQVDHPYDVALKSSIEENLREWCEKEFVIVESCVSVKDLVETKLLT